MMEDQTPVVPKTYTPIGTAWIEIDTLGGKRLPQFYCKEYAETFLAKATAEYGNVKILSHPIDYGHTNRDGQHTSDVRIVYRLLREVPSYSQADRAEMLRDQVLAALKGRRFYRAPAPQATKIDSIRAKLTPTHSGVEDMKTAADYKESRALSIELAKLLGWKELYPGDELGYNWVNTEGGKECADWCENDGSAFLLMTSYLGGYYEAREYTHEHCIVIGIPSHKRQCLEDTVVVYLRDHKTKQHALRFAITLATTRTLKNIIQVDKLTRP